jgi:hypothetical protein
MVATYCHLRTCYVDVHGHEAGFDLARRPDLQRRRCFVIPWVLNSRVSGWTIYSYIRP